MRIYAPKITVGQIYAKYGKMIGIWGSLLICRRGPCMDYQTEQQLEDGFINRLVKNGYERILIKETDALGDNFRKQMNRMKAEGLKVQELSDIEFERLLLLI